MEITKWIANYICYFKGYAITHPFSNFNSGLAKPPLKLGHEWEITSHMKQWMWLLIHALNSVGERDPWAWRY